MNCSITWCHYRHSVDISHNCIKLLFRLVQCFHHALPDQQIWFHHTDLCSSAEFTDTKYIFLPLPWSVWLSQWSTVWSVYNSHWLHPSLPWLVNYSVWCAVNRIIWHYCYHGYAYYITSCHTFCVSVISKLSETFAISYKRYSKLCHAVYL